MVIRDLRFVGRTLPMSRSRQRAREPRSALLWISRILRLWRERHRQRQELAMLTDRELRDAGVPRELVVHEARKWAWQHWHPQLQKFDDVIWRRITGSLAGP